jgi:hypothetical protein
MDFLPQAVGGYSVRFHLAMGIGLVWLAGWWSAMLVDKKTAPWEVPGLFRDVL